MSGLSAPNFHSAMTNKDYMFNVTKALERMVKHKMHVLAREVPVGMAEIDGDEQLVKMHSTTIYVVTDEMVNKALSDALDTAFGDKKDVDVLTGIHGDDQRRRD
jgi:hypothetical protein